MHELSIAESIIQVAECHAAGRRVTRVQVKVGHLRQVENVGNLDAVNPGIERITNECPHGSGCERVVLMAGAAQARLK